MRAGAQHHSNFDLGRDDQRFVEPAAGHGAGVGSLSPALRFPPGAGGRSQLFAFAGASSHILADRLGQGFPRVWSLQLTAATGALVERHAQTGEPQGIVPVCDPIEPGQPALRFRHRAVSLRADPGRSGPVQLISHDAIPTALPASSIGNMNLKVGSITLRAGAIAQ